MDGKPQICGSSPSRNSSPSGPPWPESRKHGSRSEEHTSELQSLRHLVCRLLLEKKKKTHRLLHLLGCGFFFFQRPRSTRAVRGDPRVGLCGAGTVWWSGPLQYIFFFFF